MNSFVLKVPSAAHLRLPLLRSTCLRVLCSLLCNRLIVKRHRTTHRRPCRQMQPRSLHHLQVLPLPHRRSRVPKHLHKFRRLLAGLWIISTDRHPLPATHCHPLPAARCHPLPVVCRCPLPVACCHPSRLLIPLLRKLRGAGHQVTSHHGPSDLNITAMFTQLPPTSLGFLVGISGRGCWQVILSLRAFRLLDL